MNKKIILALALIAVVAFASDTPAITAATNALCGSEAFWSNDNCHACPTGCNCAAYNTCDSCRQNGWIRRSATDATLGCYNPVATDSSNSANASVQTITNCSTVCADLTNKTTACYTCSSGSAIKGNTCTTCTDANCATCSFASATATTSTCTVCTSKYYLASSGTCTACPSTLTNCAQCNTDGTTCKTCNTGYYNSGANGTCVACLGMTCDSTGKVLTCADGFFLDISTPATPKCTACGGNCRVCSSATVCSTCNTGTATANDWVGYYLKDNACTACPSNAKYCTATAVVMCNTGYYAYSNECVAVIANCLQHSTTTKSICTKCATTGYVFHSNACVAISSVSTGCTAATSATAASTAAECTKCADGSGTTRGYFLANKVCTQCGAGVKICTDATYAGISSCLDNHVKNLSSTVTCLDCTGTKSGLCFSPAGTVTKAQCLQSAGGSPCTIDATTEITVPVDACAVGYVLIAAVSGGEGAYCAACTGGGLKGCSHCKTGSDQTKCKTCLDGFNLAADACTACSGDVSSGCTSAKCYKGIFTDATASNAKTIYAAVTTTSCISTTDALTVANAIVDSNGKVTGCNNNYSYDSTGNTNIGKCGACKDIFAGASSSNCNTCTATSTTSSFTCLTCATATNTIQGASKNSCADDSNCAQVASNACTFCKTGYNVATDGKCTACSGACTFTCPTPATTSTTSTSSTSKTNSGSLLTFAFSAIVLVLAALF